MTAVEFADPADYLRSKGISFREGTREIQAPCWECGEPPEGRKRKLYINRETWLGHCFVCEYAANKRIIFDNFGDELGENDISLDIFRRTRIYEAYVAAAQEQLPGNARAMELISGRISKEDIEEFRIGYVPVGVSLAGSIDDPDGKPYSISATEAAGLRNSDYGFDTLKGRLTIPYVSRGRIATIRGRAVESTVKAKYLSLVNAPSLIFNYDEIAERGAQNVILCEGELDAINLRRALKNSPRSEHQGYTVVGLAGKNVWPGGQEGFASYFEDVKRVYIAFDSDDAGKKAAKLARDIIGAKAKIVELPSKDRNDNVGDCDWSDFLAPYDENTNPFGGHDVNDVYQLIQEAEAVGKSLFTVGEVFAQRVRMLDETGAGLKMGIAGLDAVLAGGNGMQPGNVIIPVAKPGTGKGQPLDTVIPTPSGPCKFGDLAPGDMVFSSEGTPTEVLAVHDRGVLETYLVTFSDGTSLEVDGDHLWTVQYRSGRKREWLGEKTLDTRSLAATPLAKLKSNGSKESLYRIPQAGALQYPEAVLPVAPYVLGAYIANGYAGSSASIRTPDREVQGRIASTESVHLSRHAAGSGTCDNVIIHGLITKVKGMGLDVRSADKFIPDIYLRASVRQRLDLLHGLMDGGGSALTGKCSVRYHSTSRCLLEDVQRLVQSLGGTAVIGGVVGARPGDTHLDGVVSIMLPQGVDAFWSGRKMGGETRISMQPIRTIRSVERTGESKEIRCITVAAEDRLYVGSEDCIVTHNSIFLLNIAYHLAIAQAPHVHVTLENTNVEVADLVSRITSFHQPWLRKEEVPYVYPRMAMFDESPKRADFIPALMDLYHEANGEYPKIVTLDYLGFFASKIRGKDQYDKVTQACDILKTAAKTCGIVIVAPHQLSRAVKQGQEIELEHMRDSSAVEDVADVAIGLWRPSRNAEIKDGSGDPLDGAMRAKFLKSRKGGTGQIVELGVSNASLVMIDRSDSRSMARVASENQRTAMGVSYKNIWAQDHSSAIAERNRRDARYFKLGDDAR